MKYSIEEKGGFQIMAKTQRFSKIEDVKGREDIPLFWSECHQNGIVKYLAEHGNKDGVLGDCVVGMCMEDSTAVKDFPYSLSFSYDMTIYVLAKDSGCFQRNEKCFENSRYSLC